VLVNGALLGHRNGLWGRLALGPSVAGSVALLLLAGLGLAPRLPPEAWPQLLWAAVAGTVSLAALAALLRPWRPAH